MRDRKSILELNYEHKIMSSDVLRDKIIRDNYLTQKDIFFYYSLNKMQIEKVSYTNINGEVCEVDKYKGLNIDSLLSSYSFYKRGVTFNTKVMEFINDENKEIINDEYNLLNNDVSSIDYKNVFYEDALIDTITYNLNNFINTKTEVFTDKKDNEECIIVNEVNGKYQLVDGFYRILYKDINKKVSVRIYKNLTNKQWFDLMITLNKHKDDINSKEFYDRGFLLGLKTRYNINIDEYGLIKDVNSNNYIGMNEILSEVIKPVKLSNGYILTTYKNDIIYKGSLDMFRRDVLTNEYFIKDLKIIKYYLGYLPINILKYNRRYNVNIISSYGYHQFIINLIRLIFTFRIKNSHLEMKNLPKNLIDIILNNKNISNTLIKIATMSQKKTIDNKLNSLYSELIEILNINLLC